MKPFFVCCAYISDEDILKVFNILAEIGDVDIVPSCLDHTSGYPHRDFTWFGLSKDTGATAFEMRASELMGDELTMKELKDVAISWLHKKEQLLINGKWVDKSVLDELPIHTSYTATDGYYIIIENGLKDVVRIHEGDVYRLGSHSCTPVSNFLEGSTVIIKCINIKDKDSAPLSIEDDDGIPF